MAGKFTERIQRMMIGRNGPDEFARFFLWVAFAVLIVSMFVTDATVRSVLSSFALAGLVYCYFRMLSKNVAKRSAENRSYLRIRTQALAPFEKLLSRIRERRTFGNDYRFYRCEKCGQRLRVPKGKGTVKVTCPKCGTSFTTKS